MHIDLVHDTVCPWCRIGKRHLEQALAQWEGEPVTITYRPFLLHPGMPPEGRDFRAHMTAIKGDSNIEPLLQRVCAAGESCDLTFDWDRVATAPNTLLSHVLLAVVPADRQTAILDAIHAAYFEQGRDIGDPAVLASIAGRAGLDRQAIATALADDETIARVATGAAWIRDQGVTGVPLFIFDGAVTVSGAQPADRLLAAMKEAARLPAASTVGAHG